MYINARLAVVEMDCACASCGAAPKAPCLQQRKLDAAKKHILHTCAKGMCLPKADPPVCKRGYSKVECKTLCTTTAAYPIYMRGVVDGFVVPHNLDMLHKHDCHINVEQCSTVCVHKYMLSGYDC